MALALAEEPQLATELQLQQTLAERRNEAISNCQFFLVDDNPVNLIGLKLAIRDFSCPSTAINSYNQNAADVLATIKQQYEAVPTSKRKVMFLDYDHGRFNGPELARLLRHEIPTMAIFSMSTHEFSTMITAYEGINLAGFCRKPSSTAVLRSAVGEFLVPADSSSR